MPERTFIGRVRRENDNGKLEPHHAYASLAYDPLTDNPCGVPVSASSLEALLTILENLGRIKGRPIFEPPVVVECPGRSGFEPRTYEALTLDEIERVRQRLRL